MQLMTDSRYDKFENLRKFRICLDDGASFDEEGNRYLPEVDVYDIIRIISEAPRLTMFEFDTTSTASRHVGKGRVPVRN